MKHHIEFILGFIAFVLSAAILAPIAIVIAMSIFQFLIKALS